MTDPRKPERHKKNNPEDQDIPITGEPDKFSGKKDEVDEKYKELEDFFEKDPSMREVEEQAAKEIEKESRKLKASKGDKPSDVFIEPTHKERLARTADTGKTETAPHKGTDHKLSQSRGLRGKNPEGRGIRVLTKPTAIEDKAAEALSSFRWLLEKATNYAKSINDDQLLSMLGKIDKGMHEEDYVALVLVVGEIEVRYANELPDELRGIMECIATYVAELGSQGIGV